MAARADSSDSNPFDDWELEHDEAPTAKTGLVIEDDDFSWADEEQTEEHAAVRSVHSSSIPSGEPSQAEPQPRAEEPHAANEEPLKLEDSDTGKALEVEELEEDSYGGQSQSRQDGQPSSGEGGAPAGATGAPHPPSVASLVDPVLAQARPAAPAPPPAPAPTAPAKQLPARSLEQEIQASPEEAEQQQEEEPLPQQERKGATASWGWGFTALKSLAAGAVRDVKELTGSLHQALAEVDEDSADDDGAGDGQAEAGGVRGRGAAADAPGPAAMGPPAGAVHQGAAAGPPAAQPAPGTAAPPAPLVADREAGEESNPELEDVEQQVELLSTGAAKALSSLWGGLSGVARNTATLVSKVEAVTLDLAKDLVSGVGVSQDVAQLQAAAARGVRGVASNVTRFGTRLEASLETVGRTALGLLEEVTGQHAPGGSGVQGRGTGHTVGADHTTAAKSYEELYDLYGGQQLSEELEHLANECARVANRARARLEAGQQAELDAVMALLGPIFSQALQCHGVPSSGSGSLAAPTPQDAAAMQAAQEQLDERYVPVRFLCQDSLTRARAFQALLLEAAKAVPPPAGTLATPAAAAAEHRTAAGPDAGSADARSTPPHAPCDGPSAAAGSSATTAGPAAGGTSLAAPTTGPDDALVVSDAEGWEADMDGHGPEGGGAQQDMQLVNGPVSVHAALLQLQAHVLKRVAELVTAQLQLLMDHGVNLAAPARSVDVQASSGVSWPPRAQQQAQLLRGHAQQMVSDMMAVGAAYAAAIQALNAHLQQSGLLQAAAQQGDSRAGVGAPAVGSTGSVAHPEVGKDEAAPPEPEDATEGQAEGSHEESSPEAVSWVAVAALCGDVQQQVVGAQKAAVGRVEEGYRGLLYTVLVRELVQRIAAGPPSPGPSQQQPANSHGTATQPAAAQ